MSYLMKELDQLISNRTYDFYSGTPYAKEVAIPEAIEGIKELIKESSDESYNSHGLNLKIIALLEDYKESVKDEIEEYEDYPSTMDMDSEDTGLKGNELSLNSKYEILSFIEELKTNVY
ncbi:hypothetical protein NY607_01700 [Lysinibacillus sp. A4]|uniref:hypothetical protein n=1 Tax=unclassified Lysinibacillus TaxID=2636778 RepID=UPI0021761A88|nr:MULTISPECIES: hypothetical protein [unclassified Lysinibacillus]MCS5499817.1 hypothetical protein [Lysinibacillus sp. A4]WGT38510.1 hypothetical protein QH639_22315 [Lysinibacillus sp. 1 U-2021]